MTSADDRVKIGEVISRAWRDQAFKAEFVKNPRKVLDAAGVRTPAGGEIKILEDTDAQAHLVLPSERLPRDKRLEKLPANPTRHQVLLHLITRAEDDPAFRGTLLQSPAAALRDVKVSLPGSAQLRVVENSASVRHLVLPRPAGAELREEDLEGVVGGSGIAVEFITVAVFVST